MSWETPEPNDLGWTAEDFREAYEARSGHPLPPLSPEEKEELARLARIPLEESIAKEEERCRFFAEAFGPERAPKPKLRREQ